MIQDNLKVFSEMLNIVSTEKNIEQKLILLSMVSYYATYNCIGAIYSDEIEDRLINISKDIFIGKINNVNIKRNSCLHVTTEFYLHGGHSRVIERWLGFDNDLENSIAIIKPENSQISDEIKKYNIYSINEENYMDKAKALFEISQKYEYVILHIHMYDIVPLLAFGHEEIKSKIFYYNQADHLFWIGRKIVSKIIDISSEGQEITKLYRNILDKEKNIVLPVPLILNTNSKGSVEEIKNIKNELNINIEKKVIVTAGSTTRFITDEYSIIDVFNDINKNLDNFIFIVIGSNKKDLFWKDICNNDNVQMIDKVSKNMFDKYVAVSDIYIESFPFSSSTSSLEMVMNDVVSILIEDDFPQFDSYTNFTHKREKIPDVIIELFSDDESSKNYLKNQEKVKNKLIEEHCKNAWQEKKNSILKNYGCVNNIHIKKEKITKYCNNLETFLKKSYSNTKLYQEDFFKLNLTNKMYLLNIIGIKSIVLKLFKKLKLNR